MKAIWTVKIKALVVDEHLHIGDGDWRIVYQGRFKLIAVLRYEWLKLFIRNSELMITPEDEQGKS